MPLDVHSGSIKHIQALKQEPVTLFRQNAEGAAFLNDDPKSVVPTFAA